MGLGTPVSGADFAQDCAAVNIAGGVTIDNAALAQAFQDEFTPVSPLNVTNDGFIAARIVNGGNAGIQVFRIADSGAMTPLHWVNQAGVITAGSAFGSGWTITNGSTAATVTGTASDAGVDVTAAGLFTWPGGDYTSVAIEVRTGSATINGLTYTPTDPIYISNRPESAAAYTPPVLVVAATSDVRVVYQQVA